MKTLSPILLIRLILLLCLTLAGLKMVSQPAHVADAIDADPAPDLSHQLFLPLVLDHYCSQKAFFDDFSNLASGWPVGEDTFSQ